MQEHTVVFTCINYVYFAIINSLKIDNKRLVIMGDSHHDFYFFDDMAIRGMVFMVNDLDEKEIPL